MVITSPLAVIRSCEGRKTTASARSRTRSCVRTWKDPETTKWAETMWLCTWGIEHRHGAVRTRARTMCAVAGRRGLMNECNPFRVATAEALAWNLRWSAGRMNPVGALVVDDC